MKKFPNIAKCLREHRNKVGVSQANLATMVGYKNGQFISNVERGLCSVPLKSLAKLAYHLKAHPEDIGDAMLRDHESHIKSVVNSIKCQPGI